MLSDHFKSKSLCTHTWSKWEENLKSGHFALRLIANNDWKEIIVRVDGLMMPTIIFWQVWRWAGWRHYPNPNGKSSERGVSVQQKWIWKMVMFAPGGDP